MRGIHTSLTLRPNPNMQAARGSGVDRQDVDGLRHMLSAIATGRSNRHFRIHPRQGKIIQKSNMSNVAAAEMAWSRGEAHTSAEAVQYMQMLDVRGGERAYALGHQAWPNYGEAIRDRKWCIARLAMMHLKAAGIRQAVILGAGLDALSLEIAARAGRPVVSYEVDASTMPYKRRVLEDVKGPAAGRVRCVTANMATTSPGRIASALAREGWDEYRPSLVVAEGISYYLPKSKLQSLLAYFRTRDGSGRIILEYLRNAASISPDRAPIPEAVLGWCGEMMGATRLSRYSDAQALDFAAGGTGRGGRAAAAAAAAAGMRTVGPTEMERGRTGGNALFPGEDSGWLAVCHGPI